MLVETIINAFIQLIVMSLIPFLYWLISKSKESFFHWLGFKKANFANSRKALLVTGLAFGLLAISGFVMIFFLKDRSVLANQKFVHAGISGFVALFIYAIIQTSLAEEIFFRGFLNKRLSRKFGNKVGNFAQASIFGIIHGVLAFSFVNFFLVLLIILFAFLAGWLLGYLDEELADGSLLPSWGIHAFMNICSSLLLFIL